MGKGRKIAAAGALILAVKAAAVLGAGAAVSTWLDELADSGRIVTASLNLEFGRHPDESASPAPTGSRRLDMVSIRWASQS